MHRTVRAGRVSLVGGLIAAAAVVALIMAVRLGAAGAVPSLAWTSDLGDQWPFDMRMLADPSRSLSLQEVLTADADFSPVRGRDVNLGYTRSAAWLRIRVETMPAEPLLLSLTPNFVDFVDVYTATQRPGLTAGDFAHHALGDHRPLPADGVSGLDDVVALPTGPSGTTLIYIRVASVNSSLNISASLYPARQHTFWVSLTSLVSGVWFGGMGILLAIQLVFYHFDRKPFYPLLAFSIFGAMLVYAGNLGLSRMLLFAHGGLGNDMFTGGSVWLGLFASSLATASILELPARAPRANRVLLGGAAIGLLGIVFVAFGGNRVFAPYGNMIIVLLATLAAALSLRDINQGGSGTRLRAAAYLILWLGLVLTLAQRSGVWALPNWIAHGYAASSLLQTLLLTGALAVRLRDAEAMNKTMSAQALMAAQAAERRATAMVDAKTSELAAAKRTAEDALRAELLSQEQQVRFMEVISHQYRTPLAVIRSNVDSIGLSLPAGDLANRDRLDRVRRGIVRLVETLEVNLARSRLQGPTFAPHLLRTSLSEVAVAAAARGGDLLQGRIVVDIAPAAEGADIMADAEMLGIAIINLLENAVKYSALTGDAPVTLSCTVEGGVGVIAVSDEGIGIPADEVAGIMGRSVRGSNARSIDGSGLGLSLVSRIAAAHGGTIEINSASGGGTTIRLVVPLLPVSAGTTSP